MTLLHLCKLCYRSCWQEVELVLSAYIQCKYCKYQMAMHTVYFWWMFSRYEAESCAAHSDRSSGEKHGGFTNERPSLGLGREFGNRRLYVSLPLLHFLADCLEQSKAVSLVSARQHFWVELFHWTYSPRSTRTHQARVKLQLTPSFLYKLRYQPIILHVCVTCDFKKCAISLAGTAGR